MFEGAARETDTLIQKHFSSPKQGEGAAHPGLAQLRGLGRKGARFEPKEWEMRRLIGV